MKELVNEQEEESKEKDSKRSKALTIEVAASGPGTICHSLVFPAFRFLPSEFHLTSLEFPPFSPYTLELLLLPPYTLIFPFLRGAVAELRGAVAPFSPLFSACVRFFSPSCHRDS